MHAVTFATLNSLRDRAKAILRESQSPLAKREPIFDLRELNLVPARRVSDGKSVVLLCHVHHERGTAHYDIQPVAEIASDAYELLTP